MTTKLILSGLQISFFLIKDKQVSSVFVVKLCRGKWFNFQKSCSQVPGKVGFQGAEMTKFFKLRKSSLAPPSEHCPGPTGGLTAPPDPQLQFVPSPIFTTFQWPYHCQECLSLSWMILVKHNIFMLTQGAIISCLLIWVSAYLRCQ